MHATARQATILSRLSSDGSATVADLAKLLAVSDETIRRDIKAMADQGLLRKVHGGAVVPDLLREPTFQKRLSSEATAKTAIARHIADRIINGDSLFLDMGSTTTYIARALAQHRDLLVVTNGVEIARILSQGGRNRVHLAGGEMRGDDGALLGPTAIRFIESFRVRLAILSVGAIDLEDGFLVFDPAEAEIAQTAMRRAKECVIAADHAKFGASAPVFVADLGKVQRLVTDSAPPAAFTRKFDEAGVKLEVVGKN